MSVNFTKCNIRILSVSIAIKMPAVERLAHKIQASLMGSQLCTQLFNNYSLALAINILL